MRYCSKCGHNEHMQYFTRVVGFFVPVDSWNPTRRNWEFDKRVIDKKIGENNG